MKRMLRQWPAVLLTLMCPLAWGDEWGTWNDLPNNLLESEQDVRTLDELSNQLDRLIQQNRDVDDSLRQQLLRHWLDQINAGNAENVSLDRLLEMSTDWDDDELAEWYDDLEAYLEDQANRLNSPGNDILDTINDDETDNTDDDSMDDEGIPDPDDGLEAIGDDATVPDPDRGENGGGNEQT